MIRDNSDNYILDSYKQTKIEAQLGYLMGGGGCVFGVQFCNEAHRRRKYFS